MSAKIEMDLDYPIWMNANGKLLEAPFCAEFLKEHPMRCIGRRFYTVDGAVADEDHLKKEIYDRVSPWLESNVAKRVDNLLNALRMAAYSDPMELETDRIHVANGTYFLDDRFSPEKAYCNNRLAVTYNPDAPSPKRWQSFVSELLYPEDIPVLQEYMGYCLLPTTRGQKMLMLIGKGGEGKSRIGQVCRAIFGENMNTSSIRKVETSPFSRADLEGKLLMVDDDMDMSALPKTNHIKSIVTSEGKMDVERKGVQSYQSQLYVRFLCFGNGALTSLHDRSDGFFRRQIILTTRDKPPDREDDPFLADKLVDEREGIFRWCLEGLHRLIANNYSFTISNRAKANVAAVVREANNIVDFLASEGYISFKADGEASTSELYDTYSTWCADNAEKPLSQRSFSTYLKKNAEAYRLEATNNIYIGRGRRCWGYVGVEVASR